MLQFHNASIKLPPIIIEGNHASYINSDHNLRNLDFLVLAETKLDGSNISNESIIHLDQWNVIQRFDSKDGRKHMGLLLLSGKASNLVKEIQSVDFQTIKRRSNLQIQGLIITLRGGHRFGFIY